MILKARPEDFRVVETLDASYLGEGEYRVYRVTKRKLTTLEAAAALAKEAGVDRSAVSFGGLKDRQGITVQHVAVLGGREVLVDSRELKASPIGRAAQPLTGAWLRGNLFDLTVRGVSTEELGALRENLQEVRRFGVPNYFDDQRFGCVRHGQGFIVRELLRGRQEEALRKLVAAPSPFDDEAESRFKERLRSAWGDWGRCASLAEGRKHESLFRHLEKHPSDFVGAFCFVSSRVRLIHLYAYQSYLWNKSVSLYLRGLAGAGSSFAIPTDIGPLFCPRSLEPAAEAMLRGGTFPLLDAQTKVEDAAKRTAVEAVLKLEGLRIEDLRVEGIPGFVFKGEERRILLFPSHIRVKPPTRDELHRGRRVEIRFGLPPGAYATIVLKRLFALPEGAAREDRTVKHRPFPRRIRRA